jgi:membrane protein DedA with SNARE-associated domain
MIDFQSFILNFASNFSYLGIFLLLSVIALVPVPEEIVLLLLGYFAAFGFAELDKILVISILGVIAGDNLVYFLSGKGRKYFHKIKYKIAPKKFLKYESMMKEHSRKTIFLLRLLLD